MTQDSGVDDRQSGSFLDAAKDQVVYLRNCVQCAILRIEDMASTGQPDGAITRDVRKALSELREIASIAVKEEDRLAEQRAKENGGLYRGAFDTGAARAEVGRRLAELRAARDRDGVSGQSE